jgi:pyrimidine operon attenuation protein/uracil phosphoribosyltransferase
MKKLAVQNLILDDSDVENKIHRIGLEILEDNTDESKITLFGISDNGKLIAKKLVSYINKISDIETVLIEVVIENGPPEYTGKLNILNESIIIVGDVSQTGKTLQIVISNLMMHKPSKIKTSVIINRDQTMYPVKIDYVGLSLSTSVNEHVDVMVDKKNRFSVYLS